LNEDVQRREQKIRGAQVPFGRLLREQFIAWCEGKVKKHHNKKKEKSSAAARSWREKTDVGIFEKKGKEKNFDKEKTVGKGPLPAQGGRKGPQGSV